MQIDCVAMNEFELTHKPTRKEYKTFLFNMYHNMELVEELLEERGYWK